MTKVIYMEHTLGMVPDELPELLEKGIVKQGEGSPYLIKDGKDLLKNISEEKESELESRMDIIGQNGNDGLHHEREEDDYNG